HMLSYFYVILPIFLLSLYLFFFTDTAPTDIYTLSLHDALPIFRLFRPQKHVERLNRTAERMCIPTLDPEMVLKSWTTLVDVDQRDRKSTRLNSSHVSISYAVFCLKKKKNKKNKKNK